MGDAVQELLALYADDFEAFAEDQLKIMNKQGQIVPLVLNRAQRHVLRLFALQMQHTGRIRAIVLKGRQQGISTLTEALAYWMVMFTPGMRAFILTHEQSATDTIFEMAQRYHDNIDPVFRLQTKKSNVKELRFVTESGYQVATAGAKGAGRSKTIQFFHGSEVAWWPNDRMHAAGILQAVPDAPGTAVILESTANGTGNYFHEVWTKAWDALRFQYDGDIELMAKKHPDYIPIFVPWFWQEEYRLPVPHGWRRSIEEEQLALRYGLGDEQLVWRRVKVETLGPDLFKQEYPNEPSEAFMRSGRLFFPAESLERILDVVREPQAVGILVRERDTVRFVPQRGGWLRLWEFPDPNEHYVLGADVAEGLDEPHDRSVVEVIKRGIVSRQVAEAIPLVSPDELGKIILLIADFFGGNVWLGIERNSFGRSTVGVVLQQNYPYIYQMHKGDSEVMGERKTRKWGWETTSSSRPVLTADLQAALRDGSLEILSKEAYDELASFVILNGKPQAAKGCRDDIVMALGIAWQMHQRTRPVPKVGGYESVPDYLPSGSTSWML